MSSTDAMSAPTEPSKEWQSKLLDAETELDILQLGEGVDDDLLDAGLNQYQQYLDQLDDARTHLDALLTSTTATLNQLAEISESFKKIDDETRMFQSRSNGIIQEQRQNEKIARDLAENLQYYEPLERITRRMNAPGAGNFVRSEDFRDMLLTLDQCIDYMQTHLSHKEAETYRSRYRLLLTRALTLVRNTFMSGVREVTTDVQKRIADKQLNDTTMSALLYAKFRVDAASMKDLGLEIQKRAMPAADAEPGTEGEYQSLMNELHQSFAACRARIVLLIIGQKLTDEAMVPSSKDLVSFARASIGYIRGVCLDEFELWGEWFHGQRGVYDFLESLCEPLYDHLRPRIIHENNLSKLCSLATLLQTRYMQDDEDEMMPDPTQLDFATLIQPALEDTQTRIVFRTLAILRDEIENYKPGPDELDYPRRISAQPTTPKITGVPLSGRRRKASQTHDLVNSSTVIDHDDSGDEATSATNILWTRNKVLQNSYPTLPKSIRLLSRIYRLVNSSIFDDLAHQIVHQTTLSLVSASHTIVSKSSPPDGQLFLLRHLLLLKSQIVAFDIEYVTPDISFDFSGAFSTFYEIRERGGLFNPSSWLRLFSTGGLIPRVVENMLDAKVELDGQLRTVINEFTAGFANQMMKGVQGKNKVAKADEASKLVRDNVVKEVPVLRAKLEQYLDDSRTRETLVAAVEDQVAQIYELFFEEYVGASVGVGGGGGKKKANGAGAGAGIAAGKISKKGKGPADAVWDADTFMEWAEGVFNVALPPMAQGAEDGEESAPPSRSLSRSGSS